MQGTSTNTPILRFIKRKHFSAFAVVFLDKNNCMQNGKLLLLLLIMPSSTESNRQALPNPLVLAISV